MKMTNSVVETFSYQFKDIEEVKKAKEIARRNRISFSAYVMELLREENKKNGQPRTDPLNLSKRLLNSTRPTNNNMSLDLYILSQEEINEHLNLLYCNNNHQQLRQLRDKSSQVLLVSKIKIDLLNDKQKKVVTN